MSNANIERAVGQLQAGQTATDARLDRMEQTLAGQDDKLDRLLAHHHRQKGARTLFKSAFSLAASGGLFAWAWGYFHK